MWGTLVFPAGVVGVEYALATASPVGNILGSLAVTQHDNLPLIQLASLTGSYGVSFLIAWFAAVCNHVWQDGFAWRRVAPFGVVLGWCWPAAACGWRCRSPPARRYAWRGSAPPVPSWRRPAGRSMATTRPSCSPGRTRRRSGQAFAAVNDSLLAATQQEAGAGARARIVVWPEGGGSTCQADRQELISRIAPSPPGPARTWTPA
ncbi:hypothetical protein ACTMTI_51105 [Nonomuraea sp. H19]|uniref:hypothetical protein n=1 Tax=Nonomuraea sp. H19 TaxID=3452206 RepID=UPI003F8A63D1